MPVKPISPSDVVIQKVKDLPDEVIECWNKIIAKKWNGHSSVIIQQAEIVAELTNVMNVGRFQVFENGWLNIESLYRENGWKVEYDSPGYNETYPASFKFSNK